MPFPSTEFELLRSFSHLHYNARCDIMPRDKGKYTRLHTDEESGNEFEQPSTSAQGAWRESQGGWNPPSERSQRVPLETFDVEMLTDMTEDGQWAPRKVRLVLSSTSQLWSACKGSKRSCTKLSGYITQREVCGVSLSRYNGKLICLTLLWGLALGLVSTNGYLASRRSAELANYVKETQQCGKPLSADDNETAASVTISDIVEVCCPTSKKLSDTPLAPWDPSTTLYVIDGVHGGSWTSMDPALRGCRDFSDEQWETAFANATFHPPDPQAR